MSDGVQSQRYQVAPTPGVSVKMPTMNPFATDIGTGSRTRLVPSPIDAQAVLQVSGENREKRILSLCGAGRTS